MFSYLAVLWIEINSFCYLLLFDVLENLRILTQDHASEFPSSIIEKIPNDIDGNKYYVLDNDENNKTRKINVHHNSLEIIKSLIKKFKWEIENVSWTNYQV